MPSAPNGVIEALQASVSLHLTAIEQYQAIGEHLDRWGYAKLGAAFRADAEEEREHLRKLLSRLEYYDAQQNYDHEPPSWPRHDFEGILASSLSLEEAASEVERASILACRAVGDEGSALVFADLLADSESSIKEIEGVQKVIEDIGLDNYLSIQV